MMKKIRRGWYVLVLLILVVGMLPFSLAESDSGSGGSNNKGSDSGDDSGYTYEDSDARSSDDSDDPSDDSSIDDSDDESDDSDGRVRVRQEIRTPGGRIRVEQRIQDAQGRMERTYERHDEAKQKFAQARERYQDVKGKIGLARERYNEAKQKFAQARERYQDVKGKIKWARERLQECKGDDSDACEQVRERIRMNAQPFLSNSADMVLEALHKLEARIEESDLSDEEKANALADLQERISEIEDAKDVIDNLDSESTDEEIREATKTIREAWRHTRGSLKRNAGMVAWAKLRHVYDQLEKLGARLDTAVAKLEEQGYETNSVQEKIDEFHARLDAAKEKFDQAKDEYKKSTTPGEVDESIKAANAYVREAHRELLEARKLLREIVQNIKGTAGDLGVIADDTDGSRDADESESANDGADDGDAAGDGSDDEDDTTVNGIGVNA